MPLYALGDKRPTLPDDGSVWIAPGAHVMGDVRLAEGASVWFNATLRGDNEPITIGRNTNIQELCLMHSDPGFPVVLGDDITVGHSAIVHGCTIGDGTLIGMGAVVLNGAKVGKNCLIGANALITEGKEIPDGSMVVGQPGKVIRSLDEAARQRISITAAHYRKRQEFFRENMTELQ
ncbi:MAG: gamma carbonic anhydrase family protein [Pseudomonadota bacterium]